MLISGSNLFVLVWKEKLHAAHFNKFALGTYSKCRSHFKCNANYRTHYSAAACAVHPLCSFNRSLTGKDPGGSRPAGRPFRRGGGHLCRGLDLWRAGMKQQLITSQTVMIIVCSSQPGMKWNKSREKEEERRRNAERRALQLWRPADVPRPRGVHFKRCLSRAAHYWHHLSLFPPVGCCVMTLALVKAAEWFCAFELNSLNIFHYFSVVVSEMLLCLDPQRRLNVGKKDELQLQLLYCFTNSPKPKWCHNIKQ